MTQPQPERREPVMDEGDEQAVWDRRWEQKVLRITAERDALLARVERLRAAADAVLLFHSASPWTEAKKTEWWNLTQTNEATTRNLCDAVRLALGRLPSCFGNFTGRLPTEIPADMRLSREQQIALEALAADTAAAKEAT